MSKLSLKLLTRGSILVSFVHQRLGAPCSCRLACLLFNLLDLEIKDKSVFDRGAFLFVVICLDNVTIRTGPCVGFISDRSTRLLSWVL